MRNQIPLCLLLVLLVACGGVPGERPADFEVTLDQDGGMNPESIRIEYDGPDSRFTVFNQGTALFLGFEATSAQMDAAHALLTDNSFNTMQTRSIEAYDRGGWSVRARWEGESRSVSDAGMEEVRSLWSNEFSTIVSGLQKLVTQPNLPATTTYELRLDPSLNSFYGDLTVNFGTAFRGAEHAYHQDYFIVLIDLYEPADSYPLTFTDDDDNDLGLLTLRPHEEPILFLQMVTGQLSGQPAGP